MLCAQRLAQKRVERMRGKVERLKYGQAVHNVFVVFFGHVAQFGVGVEEGRVAGHAVKGGEEGGGGGGAFDTFSQTLLTSLVTRQRVDELQQVPEDEKKTYIITINVPVVYMGRDVWIWMRGNPFEGVGPESRDFFGPLNGSENSECHLGPKKLRL